MRTSYITRYSPARESEHGDTWRNRAACADEDPELFHTSPSDRAGRGDKRVAQAKAVCAGCSVRAECLDWANSNHIREGIWGGLTSEERGYR
jgi:WhiB family redox-sensing transcriptional regulator